MQDVNDSQYQSALILPPPDTSASRSVLTALDDVSIAFPATPLGHETNTALCLQLCEKDRRANVGQPGETEATTQEATPTVDSSTIKMTNQGFPQVIDLNVGGSAYTTSLETLTSVTDSLLSQMFSEPSKLPPPPKDSSGRYFLDRDGLLFRYVLDFLRSQKLTLPENFAECERLKLEADHFRLPQLARNVSRTMALHKPPHLPPLGDASNHAKNNDDEARPAPGYVVLGYRGTFAVGRDGLADVKFRKLARLLVSGQVRLCREAFGETLNESRDPDRGSSSRYTNRFFLKHNSIEQAFDNLQAAGFRMVGASSSGTSGCGDLKPGMDSEESRWNHYNEFVFVRD